MVVVKIESLLSNKKCLCLCLWKVFHYLVIVIFSVITFSGSFNLSETISSDDSLSSTEVKMRELIVYNSIFVQTVHV